jgi:hypothetical protein
VRLINHKKLNFWRAVTLIGGIPLALVLYWAAQPMTASSQTQPRPSVSATGNQSPAIGSSGRDVIINYNAPVKGTSPELQRSTLLLDSPNLANLNSQESAKHIVCNVRAGTAVSLTGHTEPSNQIKDYWQEVTITTGNCAGKSGWVVWDSLQK